MTDVRDRDLAPPEPAAWRGAWPPAWPAGDGDPSWFTAATFGLFIHWGVYSAGHDCWMQFLEKISPADYERRFVEGFDPDLFDPAAWAEDAWAAGMRYVVLITKHHDGFCLWDSDLTDFKATNVRAGRDLVAPVVDAFRKRGFRIGFYYSLLDWHHPDFALDGLHPVGHDLEARTLQRDMGSYRDYMKGQLTELLTRFGRIDYLWFDFSYEENDYGWSKGKGPKDWDSVGIEEHVRALQPDIILNDRLGLNRGVLTAEMRMPEVRPLRDGQPVIWELNNTENRHWGYYRDDRDWKTPEQIVRMLVDVVSKGGNFLLNIGPTARGAFSPHSRQLLRAVGEWIEIHEAAIRGAGPSAFEPPRDCRYTQRGHRLYLHVFNWQQELGLPGLAGRVARARTFDDGSEIEMGQRYSDPQRPGDFVLLLPMRPDVLVPVIELTLIDAET